MKAATFDSTTEFAHFQEAMRKVLTVSKVELDQRVESFQKNSPHKRNPRKARPARSAKSQ